MTDNTKTAARARSRAAAARELETWAEEHRFTDNDVVTRLAASLRSSDDLTAWSTVDLGQHLPDSPGRAVTKSIWSKIASSTLVVRNALVFVPVVIAWLAIGSASDGYRSAVARLEPGEQLDFLAYWTSPARGNDGLQAVARDVVWIALGIIVLTIISSITEARHNAYTSNASAAFDRKRRQLLLTLELATAPHRQFDATEVEGSLTSAIEGFRLSSNQLRESTAQLREVFDSTDALGPQLQQTTERMNEIVSLMQRDMAGSISGLNEEVNRLSAELRGLDQKLGQSLDERVNKAADVTTSVLSGFDRLANELGRLTQASEASVARVIKLVNNQQSSGGNDRGPI